MKLSLIRIGVTFVIMVLTGSLATGQSDTVPPATSGAEAAAAPDAEGFVEAAKQYAITTADASGDPFQLVPSPLLVWSNPERRTTAGAVFLYTSQGRPQAALCVYPNQDTLDHEFQTLATEPLLARRDGILLWAPQSGIEMKPLQELPSAGGTAPLRLREMRSLSRKFTASIFNAQDERIPLRLLPTPLYRYPADNLPDGVVDGALFAFVQATDPEVLLLLEAREDDAGKRQWHYGLARMTVVRLSVQLNAEDLWTPEGIWGKQNPRSPYYTIYGN